MNEATVHTEALCILLFPLSKLNVFFVRRRRLEEKQGDSFNNFRPHLVDGEADSVHVLPHLPQAPAVLLDQTDHEGAAGLSVIWVVVLLVKLDHELRVHPERVCESQTHSQRGLLLNLRSEVMIGYCMYLKQMIGNDLRAVGSLTGIVPAASCGGTSPPVALKLGQSPLRQGVIGQSVRRQVTDL